MTLESEAYQQPEPESTHRRHEWHRAATVEHHVRSDVQTEAFQQFLYLGVNYFILLYLILANYLSMSL